MQTLTQRMIGAARLDIATYEEVEHDRGANVQAGVVIVVVALAAGIGALGLFGAGNGVSVLLLTTILSLISWFIWAALIWVIGTKLLPEPQTEADIGQLWRTMGFAATPGVLRIFDFIPLIGFIIGIVVSVWMLLTTVIAVRQALDYQSTLRAIGVCALGWIIQLLIIAIFGIGATPTPAVGGG